MRKQFRISTKAAIFNTSRSKVVAIHLDEVGARGLPGGHMEEDETPEVAIARELLEECGLTCKNLQRKDFFMYSDGYVARHEIYWLPPYGRLNLAILDTLQNIPVIWVARNVFVPVINLFLTSEPNVHECPWTHPVPLYCYSDWI